MAASLLAYMRAHGNRPGPTQRPRSAGALAGLLGELPAFLVLWRSGALASLSAALGWPGPAVAAAHGAALVGAGAVYGVVFGRAANDRSAGWLFGLSYGYLIWMLVPVAALQALLGRPLAVGGAAVGLLLAHLAQGLVAGASFPYVHRALVRRTREEP